MFYKQGEMQQNGGKLYPTNEVGGIDLCMTEPSEICPQCGKTMWCDDWVDNGFGPYAVQNGPYYCEACGFVEGSN